MEYKFRFWSNRKAVTQMADQLKRIAEIGTSTPRRLDIKAVVVVSRIGTRPRLNSGISIVLVPKNVETLLLSGISPTNEAGSLLLADH